jgi:hypothetical protein
MILFLTQILFSNLGSWVKRFLTPNMWYNDPCVLLLDVCFIKRKINDHLHLNCILNTMF